MKIESFIKYAKEKGFYSAYFLANFKGEDLYAIQKYADGVARFTGMPIVLKEKNNIIYELSHEEINEYCCSLPDDEE